VAVVPAEPIDRPIIASAATWSSGTAAWLNERSSRLCQPFCLGHFGSSLARGWRRLRVSYSAVRLPRSSTEQWYASLDCGAQSGSSADWLVV
jgi:hypothetical protein